MRKLVVAVITLSALFSACGEDPPPVQGGDTIGGTGLEGTITRTKIDGMDCLVWTNKKGSLDHTYAYSGITCDWRQK